MALPHYPHASARPHNGVIRIDLDTASKVVGFSCTLSPDAADKLADELRAAAKIARIETTHAEKSTASDTGG